MQSSTRKVALRKWRKRERDRRAREADEEREVRLSTLLHNTYSSDTLWLVKSGISPSIYLQVIVRQSFDAVILVSSK